MNDGVEAMRTGTGSSQLGDAEAAGREAAGQAVRALGGATPALVVTYASPRYHLPRLLGGIRSVTGDAPLIGATSSGQFLDGELIAPGRGVGVLALTAGPYRFGVASRTGLSTRPFEVGQDLARDALAALDGDQPRHGAILVLADSLSGDLQSLLNGVYRVAGARVPVVGGAAGADRGLEDTHVFHDGEVFDDGAVAVWIGTEQPLRVVSGHGWRAHGLPMLVTRVEGTVVHEIGGRPAMEVYQEQFRTPDTPADADLDWWKGLGPARAFGLVESDGSEIVRCTYVGEDGLPRTFAPLQPYSAVRIMTTTQDDLLDVCERIVSEALADREAGILLMFSCSARMEILAERAGEKAAGPVPTFGFYTYGEFARVVGVSGYHNATLAALAL